MLNFINKKGEKVMEMKDDGSLKNVSEKLQQEGIEESESDKKKKKDSETDDDK